MLLALEQHMSILVVKMPEDAKNCAKRVIEWVEACAKKLESTVCQ